VLRQHGRADRAAGAHVAAREFRLLQLLSQGGLRVPAPRLLDESGEILPSPYLVLDFVESDPKPPNGPAAAIGLAAALVEIHTFDASGTGLPSFLPDVGSLAAPARPNDPVLLHGDFWPGNALWKGGRVAAIVDWDDAALGDPLADVANCRLELVWAFGPVAAGEFTHHYLRASPGVDVSDLPRWDVRAAERLLPHLHEWGLEGDEEHRLRALAQSFAASARERVSSR
jgi:aminoglycoside phosphotransferase (APT) family kinase protein